MEKCSCYINHPWSDKYGYCMGTKYQESCYCQGDESRCTYYPEKRHEKMNTFNMMIKAKETGNTYRAGDVLYSSHLGFHDKLGKKWYGDAFEYLNDLFAIDEWQEDNNIYMTKSEAEKKYGIKIVD